MINLKLGLTPLLLATLLLISVATVTRVSAQTPTPSPSAEELRLQEEKRLLELQRDIEQAKKAIRDAQPQPAAPSATPLAGDTALENVKLEAEMVAYKAMSEAADRISKEVKSKKNNAVNIAIYDAQVVKDWRFYRALFPAFKGQIDDLKAQYKALLCQDASISAEVSAGFLGSTRCTDPNRDVMTAAGGFQAAFGAGATLLKSFVDLAALFRTDTKIQGMAFTLDESAFVAEVFRALKNDYGTITLYYPEVFPPRVTDSSETVTIIGDLFIYKTEADSVIKKKNADKETTVTQMAVPAKKKAWLEEQKTQVKGLNAKLEALVEALKGEKNPTIRKKIRAEIARVKVALAEIGESEASLDIKIQAQEAILAPLEAKIKQINADVKKLTSLNERFLAFVNDFVKVDPNGINALALFIKSEDIQNAMADPESYWLEIKSVSAGGNNRVRKNLLRFFSGAKLDHSGGVIVEYTLYEKSGAVVYSDKISVYEGYVEPKRIRGTKVFEFKDKVD